MRQLLRSLEALIAMANEKGALLRDSTRRSWRSVCAARVRAIVRAATVGAAEADNTRGDHFSEDPTQWRIKVWKQVFCSGFLLSVIAREGLCVGLQSFRLSADALLANTWL